MIETVFTTKIHSNSNDEPDHRISLAVDLISGAFGGLFNVSCQNNNG